MTAIDPQTLDPRRALQVTRYHTWPRLREQSVGEHSAQVMRILLAIWPSAPRELLILALIHDIGEVATGDVPYPVKKDNKTIKHEFDVLELRAQGYMEDRWGLPVTGTGVTCAEHVVMKIADLLEMWEWSLYEQGLGNTYARLVGQRVLENVMNLIGGDVEVTHPGVATAVRKYVQTRLDYEDQCTGG